MFPKIKSDRQQRKAVIKRLDVLIADIVKERDNHTCRKCGSTNKQLNAAHIFSRKFFQIRWNLLNLITLCVDCHLNWAHKDPLSFAEWAKEQIGERNLLILRASLRNKFKKSLVNLKLLEKLLKEGNHAI